MILFFYLFMFVFGTAVGSFLGVVVDRVLGEESIWKGRSHCDHCRHKLAWNDLIPVVSYFLLKQKCRYCHEKLNWFYPTIELLTGLSFTLAAYAVFQGSILQVYNLNYLLLLGYYFAVIASFLTIFFTDLKYGIIPFKVVFFATAVTLIWYLTLPALYFLPVEIVSLGIQTNVLNALLSALGSFGLFFALFYLTKGRGMGFGDVVFAFLMGLVLGFPKVGLALYLAFITGAIVSLILVAAHLKKLKGGTIPFGPFLVFGTIVSLLFGNYLITLITHYLFG
jgi:prepilin signal peptidase PulO-like enzyme (type II secretory pathway)